MCYFIRSRNWLPSTSMWVRVLLICLPSTAMWVRVLLIWLPSTTMWVRVLLIWLPSTSMWVRVLLICLVFLLLFLFVLFCVSWPMLPVSRYLPCRLCWPFLIVPSIFSNVYFHWIPRKIPVWNISANPTVLEIYMMGLKEIMQRPIYFIIFDGLKFK